MRIQVVSTQLPIENHMTGDKWGVGVEGMLIVVGED